MRYLKYNEAYSKSKIDSINAERIEQANDYLNNFVDLLKKDYANAHIISEPKLLGQKSNSPIDSRIEVTSTPVKIEVNCIFTDYRGRPYVHFDTYHNGESYGQVNHWLIVDNKLNFEDLKKIKSSVDNIFDKINFYEKMTKQDVVEIFQELTDIIGEIPKIDELDVLYGSDGNFSYRYEIIYTIRSNFIYPEDNQDFSIPTDKHVSVVSELRDIDYRLRSGFNSSLIYEYDNDDNRILIYILNFKVK